MPLKHLTLLKEKRDDTWYVLKCDDRDLLVMLFSQQCGKNFHTSENLKTLTIIGVVGEKCKTEEVYTE